MNFEQDHAKLESRNGSDIDRNDSLNLLGIHQGIWNSTLGQVPTKSELLDEYERQTGGQDDEMTQSIKKQIESLSKDDLKLISKVADDDQLHSDTPWYNLNYITQIELYRRAENHNKTPGQTPTSEQLVDEFNKLPPPSPSVENVYHLDPKYMRSVLRELSGDDLQAVGKLADDESKPAGWPMRYNYFSLAGIEVNRRVHNLTDT